MRRLIYLFLALLLPAISFGDTSADKQLEAGNALYAKRNYKGALAAYIKTIDAGYQSAALYYNTGNAYYKLDQIPSAILYYEKARKLAPGDEDIQFNIRFANQQTADKIEEAPEFVLTRWWHTLILHYSVSFLSTLSVALFLLASIVILYFFSPSVGIKKLSFFVAVTFFVLGLLTILTAASQLRYFNDHKQSIIFSESIVVKSAPAEKASSLFVLHEGTKVSTFRTSNGWTKITLANGNEGWIKAADLKAI